MSRYWVHASNLIYVPLCFLMFFSFGRAWNEWNLLFLFIVLTPVPLLWLASRAIESTKSTRQEMRAPVALKVACVTGPAGIILAFGFGPHVGYVIPLPFLIIQVTLVLIVLGAVWMRASRDRKQSVG